MESLNFKDANLSRRLNRIIRNFGRGIVKEKLTSLNEEYGIVITEVPAAYTSQECPNCHHVEKGNRKTRDKFECKKCGFKRHADVLGAINIGSRCSWPEVKLNVKCYVRREVVLSNIANIHRQWCIQHRLIRKQCSRKQLYESG